MDADLIDSNPFEPLEGWLGEMFAEVRLPDLLDRVPTRDEGGPESRSRLAVDSGLIRLLPYTHHF